MSILIGFLYRQNLVLYKCEESWVEGGEASLRLWQWKCFIYHKEILLSQEDEVYWDMVEFYLWHSGGRKVLNLEDQYLGTTDMLKKLLPIENVMLHLVLR